MQPIAPTVTFFIRPLRIQTHNWGYTEQLWLQRVTIIPHHVHVYIPHSPAHGVWVGWYALLKEIVHARCTCSSTYEYNPQFFHPPGAAAGCTACSSDLLLDWQGEQWSLPSPPSPKRNPNIVLLHGLQIKALSENASFCKYQAADEWERVFNYKTNRYCYKSFSVIGWPHYRVSVCNK